MTTATYENLFTPETLQEIFPESRADQFFDAMYGDPEEGAYNISLKFKRQTENTIVFEFHLTRRPGKCLRCNLTYGLPPVFSRHPVIDVKGLVKKIDQRLTGQARCRDWKLGETMEMSDALHVIPLTVFLEPVA
ncbi:MAG: pancreas/duodenum homeobox protein 1 [Desulfobacteraceae bacterium]|nr:MAG: pancreas/duodenum homeobox protein 1 [Desulfobacteraceae bacterium]